MSNVTEFVISSDASGQLWTACIWDPHAGTSLMIYKGGGVSTARTLCFLGNDYLITAENLKPMLNIWPLNSQERVQQGLRLVCPGKVSALAVSLDATYCVAGIDEKLHVWQIASGRLLAVAARHFQKVTCVKFTDDGSHFVSGGADGMVLVWSLAELVSQKTGDSGDPRNSFSDHSLPVQDLHVGHGGIRARLISVSMDRTCKIYNLAAGKLLLSVIFNSPLMSVTTDPIEFNVFVGTSVGAIYQFGLQEPPRMREYHIESMDDKAMSFTGHTLAVTCLSTSLDGLTLLSGSNDEKVMLWHIPSRQCTRVLLHKGPILNAYFAVAPKQVFSAELKPKVLLHNFQRGMGSDETDFTIDTLTTVDLSPNEVSPASVGIRALPMANNNNTKIRDERNMYQQVNNQLYKFVVQKIIEKSQNETEVEQEEAEQPMDEMSFGDDYVSFDSSAPEKKKKKKKISLLSQNGTEEVEEEAIETLDETSNCNDYVSFDSSTPQKKVGKKMRKKKRKRPLE